MAQDTMPSPYAETPPPTAEAEARRLADLRTLDRLVVTSSETVRRLVDATRHIFATPVAALSLVDADEEIFCPGLDTGARSGPRDQAFCNHTIRREGPLFVPDSTLDPRFRQLSPTAKDGVRFYAGVPVHGPGGHRIGALCVRDFSPKPETPDDRALNALLDLGSVMDTLLADHAQFHVRMLTQASVDNAADGVLWIDARGRILYANNSGRKLLDIDTAGMPHDLSLFEIERGLTPTGFAKRWDTCERLGAATFEADIITFKGRTVPVEIRFSRVNHDGMEIACFVCTDITLRRDAIRQLETARAIAQDANHAKAAFLANMSHEIRTPMAAVLGFTDLLADEPDPAVAAEHISTIRRNGEHLLGLINDILDLSRIDSGEFTIERIHTDPAVEIRAAVGMLRSKAAQKNLTLTVDVDRGVPTTVLTDPTRLRQIAVNLVGNAIKFTDVGGVAVTVKRAPALDTATCLGIAVIVQDTGIGIAPDALGRIFEPFQQAESSTTRRFGGTGLGLAIARKLATNLGGELTATSNPNAGSTFTLTLRTERSTEEQPADPPSANVDDAVRVQLEPSAASPQSLHGLRVLFAEDGPDNQRLISHFLTKAGAELTFVDNGRDAVDTALDASPPFDLVLMDMQMPVLDGYSATRQLRDLGVSTPILALTAHAMADDRARCLAAGCDGYLAKPFTAASITAACAQHAA